LSYLIKPNKKIEILDLEVVDDFWDVDWDDKLLIKEATKDIKNLTIFINKNKNIEFDIEIKKIKLEPVIVLKEVTKQKDLIFEIASEYENYDVNFFMEIKPKFLYFDDKVIECDYSKLDELKGKFQKFLKKENGIFDIKDYEFLLEQDVAEKFLENFVLEFVDIKLYGNEKLKKFNYILANPKIDLKVEFENKVSLIDEVLVDVDDEKISLSDIFNYYKNNYVLVKDKKIVINQKYVEKLKRVFKKKNDKFEVSIFDIANLDSVGEIKFNRKFFEEFNKLKDKKFNYPKLNVTLREYQKYGVKWLKLLYDYEFGGCLADDMGLGKTIQMIALIKLVYKNDKQILIVVPKSLVFNWKNELKKVANLECLVVQKKEDLKNLQKINLITYGFLRNNIENIKNEFDMVILDESQNIKNITSKIRKAISLLKANHKFALSGTPIENNLFELYSIFEFLNPMFRSVEDFRQNYVLPILNGDEEVANELKSKIRPFILRRLKKDVLDFLPEKEEIIYYINMNEKQQQEYNSLKAKLKRELNQIDNFKKRRFFVLKVLQELRKKVIFFKLNEIIKELKKAIQNNHKVLVFSNFLSVLDEIEKNLDYKFIKMTGSTKNREELVKKFNENKDIKAMLMTLKVGGVGLNLVSADYVFIVDPWWNVAAESQAIDRAYRIGQKKKVFSYKFIVKNSIEEKMLELQKQKKELANSIIEIDAISKILDEENITYLLGD